MAKRNHKETAAQSGTGLAVAEKERLVSAEGSGGKPDSKGHRNARGTESQPGGATASRRGFFDIYKSGQGKHTRLGTALAAGALVCWFAYFLYDKFSVIGDGSNTRVIQIGVAIGVLLVFGLVGYWILGLNRKVSDFLIATEGEMKKVNWTTRKDIIGSTKVVVFMVIAMAILLFLVDMFFMSFFSAIGILKAGGGLLDTIWELF